MKIPHMDNTYSTLKSICTIIKAPVNHPFFLLVSHVSQVKLYLNNILFMAVAKITLKNFLKTHKLTSGSVSQPIAQMKDHHRRLQKKFI